MFTFKVQNSFHFDDFFSQKNSKRKFHEMIQIKIRQNKTGHVLTYLGSRNEDEAEFGAIGFLQRRGNFTKSRRRKGNNQAN